MRSTQVIMECLLEQGVDTVFGYPGGTILNLYDELYRYSDCINHVLTAHEQGASHAADGYARATGKVGVCFATSGPGFTNLTTGIATAYLDSSPVVFITCNVGESLLGKDSFQEVDSTGIAMPITKAAFLVRDAQQIPHIMRQAFAVASSGRPGPVLIDFLKNVTAADQSIDFEPLTKDAVETHKHEPDAEDIQTLLKMIGEAQRPMLICGGGVVRGRAHEEFREFAERIHAPVAITLMGGGGFPGNHPQTSGMIGMHGSKASNVACSKCDLLIAVGCRFSDRVALNPTTFAANAKIVQIDIDRAEIDKNVLTDHHIVGSAKDVLSALLKDLPQYNHSDWVTFIQEMKAEVTVPETELLNPQQLVDVVDTLAPADSIIATDVGQHQMWTIQQKHFTFPGQLLTSGGFGTMGFGLGAAIGAQTAFPDRKVIHMTGDGCFRMNCHELCTVEHYGLPVITLIFDNGTLGMVRQWQNIMYGKRFSATTLDRGPDFVKLAEAYGLNGVRVTTREQLETAFAEALKADKGTVIDCILDIDAMVSPMVSPGKNIDDFTLC